MRASRNALDLIKQFEGCQLEAYQDVVGVWTIGYGTTGPGIREGLKITQSVAEGMLLDGVGIVSQGVSELLRNRCNQNQLDALVSLVYNIGLNAFKKSTMLKLIQDGKMSQAADEFLKWDHAGGKVIPGLTKRREAERTLFLT